MEGISSIPSPANIDPRFHVS